MKRTSRELRLGIRALLGLLLIFLISGERATNLVGQAADTSTWRAISSPFATEDEVLEFLRTARVVSKKRIRKGLNQPFRVRLDKDGVEATAVFRDVDVIVAKAEMNGTLRTNYRDDALFEVAAYELNRMLGLKLVPPTVFRKVDGQKGSLQIFIDGAMTEGDRVDRKLTSPRPREWALLRQIRWIFDALIHNDDRNLGNSLIDKDWNLWLIDHTRCFYPLARLPKKDNLTHIEAKLWERLKETEQDEVRGRLKSTLEKPKLMLFSSVGHSWSSLCHADRGAGGTTGPLHSADVREGGFQLVWKTRYLLYIALLILLGARSVSEEAIPTIKFQHRSQTL